MQNIRQDYYKGNSSRNSGVGGAAAGGRQRIIKGIDTLLSPLNHQKGSNSTSPSNSDDISGASSTKHAWNLMPTKYVPVPDAQVAGHNARESEPERKRVSAAPYFRSRFTETVDSRRASMDSRSSAGAVTSYSIRDYRARSPRFPPYDLDQAVSKSLEAPSIAPKIAFAPLAIVVNDPTPPRLTERDFNMIISSREMYELLLNQNREDVRASGDRLNGRLLENLYSAEATRTRAEIIRTNLLGGSIVASSAKCKVILCDLMDIYPEHSTYLASSASGKMELFFRVCCGLQDYSHMTQLITKLISLRNTFYGNRRVLHEKVNAAMDDTKSDLKSIVSLHCVNGVFNKWDLIKAVSKERKYNNKQNGVHQPQRIKLEPKLFEYVPPQDVDLNEIIPTRKIHKLLVHQEIPDSNAGIRIENVRYSDTIKKYRQDYIADQLLGRTRPIALDLFVILCHILSSNAMLNHDDIVEMAIQLKRIAEIATTNSDNIGYMTIYESLLESLIRECKMSEDSDDIGERLKMLIGDTLEKFEHTLQMKELFYQAEVEEENLTEQVVAFTSNKRRADSLSSEEVSEKRRKSEDEYAEVSDASFESDNYSEQSESAMQMEEDVSTVASPFEDQQLSKPQSSSSKLEEIERETEYLKSLIAKEEQKFKSSSPLMNSQSVTPAENASTCSKDQQITDVNQSPSAAMKRTLTSQLLGKIQGIRKKRIDRKELQETVTKLQNTLKNMDYEIVLEEQEVSSIRKMLSLLSEMEAKNTQAPLTNSRPDDNSTSSDIVPYDSFLFTEFMRLLQECDDHFIKKNLEHTKDCDSMQNDTKYQEFANYELEPFSCSGSNENTTRYVSIFTCTRGYRFLQVVSRIKEGDYDLLGSLYAFNYDFEEPSSSLNKTICLYDCIEDSETRDNERICTDSQCKSIHFEELLLPRRGRNGDREAEIVLVSLMDYFKKHFIETLPPTALNAKSMIQFWIRNLREGEWRNSISCKDFADILYQISSLYFSENGFIAE